MRILQILRQRIRVPPCATTEADAESNTERLLRWFERHAEAAMGRGVEGIRHNTEFGMGTLRSTRAGASHLAVQVRTSGTVGVDNVTNLVFDFSGGLSITSRRSIERRFFMTIFPSSSMRSGFAHQTTYITRTDLSRTTCILLTANCASSC